MIGISIDSQDILSIDLCNWNGFYEISDFCMPNKMVNVKEKIQKVSKIIGNGNIKCIQGPIRDVKPEAMDWEIREITKKRFVQLIDCASEFDIQYVMFFTTFDNMVGFDFYTDMWLSNNINFWKEIVDYAQQKMVTCLYCNVWDDTPTLLLKLFEEINSDYFRFAFDIGHAYYSSRVSLFDWIDILGKYISYVLVHDNNGQRDEHLMIGEGSIPIIKLINYIEKKYDDMLYCIQTFDKNQVIPSASRLNKILIENKR